MKQAVQGEATEWSPSILNSCVFIEHHLGEQGFFSVITAVFLLPRIQPIKFVE